MCNKCETTAKTMGAKPRIRVNGAEGLSLTDSVLLTGTSSASIKPFVTLDDALATGEKIGRLLFPAIADKEIQLQKYQHKLSEAVATLTLAKPEDKFEALSGVLGVVLMGFEAEDLPDLKVYLANQMERAVNKNIAEHTSEYLKSTGFRAV